MSLTAKKQNAAVYEDLLALPDGVVGEIVDGELYSSPRPSARHANAASSLLSELHRPFQFGRGGPGGWWILIEPELRLGQQVLVPDLAGWRKTRLQKLPDVDYFDLVPDWVCEILSPSNARLDRTKKVPEYAKLGVKHLWLVDPIATTLEVFRLENTRWLLLQTFSAKDKFRAEPFEVLEFDLSSLWGE